MTGLQRHIEDGLFSTALQRPGGGTQHWITATPRPGESPDALAARVRLFLDRHGAMPAVMVGVGTPDWPDAFRRVFAPFELPTGWLACAEAESPASVQVVALAGVKTVPILLDGARVGVSFEDEHARYGLLGGLVPVDGGVDRAAQACSLWKRMEAAFESAGFPFTTLVRTWLFPNRILEWYDVFNRVRDEQFRLHGIYDGVVPASTGIGIGNLAQREMMVASALTFQPKGMAARAFMVPSPLQCPALQYGSSFSRAVELETPGHRRLFISGTASIEPGGATAHVGDVVRQVELTMDVVQAILVSRGMNWDDVVRGVAYFKHRGDLPEYARYVRAHGLPPMPVALVHADICRDDLLFEIELDAVSLRPAS